MVEELALRVVIQTVADIAPFHLRTRKVEFQNSGIYFIGLDTNQIYLFDYVDVIEIIPDEEPPELPF